jgi:hypothetical protein
MAKLKVTSISDFIEKVVPDQDVQDDLADFFAVSNDVRAKNFLLRYLENYGRTDGIPARHIKAVYPLLGYSPMELALVRLFCHDPGAITFGVRLQADG